MKSKGIKFFIGISSLFVSLIQLASASSPGLQANVFGGISRTQMTSSLIHISPQETDLMEKDNATDTTFGAGIAYVLPLERILNNHPNSIIKNLLFGVDYFYYNTQLGGGVQLYESAKFTNYDYTLNLRTNRLMLNIQWLFLPQWQNISPYVGAGIGGTRIRTRYYEQPKVFEMIYNGELNLTSRTNTNFVYSLTVGVRKPLTSQIELFLSYLYTDFGSAYTSCQSTLNVIESPIKIKVATQTGLLGISYAFDIV